MQEIPWVQPTISSNGVLGGSTFAVAGMGFQNGYAYYAFDKNDSTYCYAYEPYPETFFIEFYNPIPLKVTSIKLSARLDSVSYGGATGTLYGSNNDVEWYPIVGFAQTTNAYEWTIDCSSNTNFYKYYKLGNITATTNTLNNYRCWQFRQMDIAATYSGEADTQNNLWIAPVKSKYLIKYTGYSLTATTNYVIHGDGLLQVGEFAYTNFTASNNDNGNYLTTGVQFLSHYGDGGPYTNSSWEIGLGFKTAEGTTNGMLSAVENCAYVMVENNRLRCKLKNGGGSESYWNICDYTSENDLLENTNYYVKLRYNASTNYYTMLSSIDKETWTQEFSFQNNQTCVGWYPETALGVVLRYGGSVSENPFNGTIHLDECYQICDNEYVWRGVSYS